MLYTDKETLNKIIKLDKFILDTKQDELDKTTAISLFDDICISLKELISTIE